MYHIALLLFFSCSPSEIRQTILDSGEPNRSETTSELKDEDSLQEPIEDSSALAENPQTLDDNDLPDLTANLDHSACNNTLQGEAGMEGATSYYVGTFIEQSNQSEGTEQWIVFPNDVWRDNGGENCIVEWDLNVEYVGSSDCTDCTYLMEVEAFVNLEKSTCNGIIMNRVGDWSSVYQVDVVEKQTIFSYHSTGEEFGWGFHVENASNFVSDPVCVWR